MAVYFYGDQIFVDLIGFCFLSMIIYEVLYICSTWFLDIRTSCKNIFKDEQIVSSRTRRPYNFKDKYFRGSENP